MRRSPLTLFGILTIKKHTLLPPPPSWSYLPPMTTRRWTFGLLCFPPTGSLIALGGHNMVEGQLNSVEILRDDDGCRQWRRLAPLPALLQNPGVEYFRERVFVLGGTAAVFWRIPSIIMSNPPGSDHISQWTYVHQRTRYPTPAAFVTASGNRLFLFGK